MDFDRNFWRCPIFLSQKISKQLLEKMLKKKPEFFAEKLFNFQKSERRSPESIATKISKEVDGGISAEIFKELSEKMTENISAEGPR